MARLKGGVLAQCIHPRMSREQVEALLGPCQERGWSAGARVEEWDYRDLGVQVIWSYPCRQWGLALFGNHAKLREVRWVGLRYLDWYWGE
jgi:hypothetical protein